MNCEEHKYIFGGIRFKDTEETLAGTGARRRRYYEFYFCERCLNPYVKELVWNERNMTTYDGVLYNATPLT